MRIALIIERFEPGGGVENVAWGLAHRLQAVGEDVEVVARRFHPEARVRVKRLRVPGAWQPARVLAFSYAAARAAPRDAYDVVHSLSRTRHQDVYRAGGGCHAEYLARLHPGRLAGLRRLSPRHAVLLGLEARVFADTSQLVQCNSTFVRDQILRRHRIEPGRLPVVPNAVDLERFHPRRRAAEGLRRQAARARTPGPVWLLAGSGWRRKGLDTALDALALAGPGSGQLWVAGRDAPGPWQARVAALGLGRRVRFLGARDDLETLYAVADGLLLPTRYDAFANACLEAAASGLPVVTSGANGAVEVLGGGVVVVERAEDVEGFAAALERLGPEETRRRLGEAGRKAAEACSWDAHLASLRDLYARAAALRPRP